MIGGDLDRVVLVSVPLEQPDPIGGEKPSASNSTAGIYRLYQYFLSKEMGYQLIHAVTTLFQVNFAPTLGGP
jgi:hypothetical protein